MSIGSVGADAGLRGRAPARRSARCAPGALAAPARRCALRVVERRVRMLQTRVHHEQVVAPRRQVCHQLLQAVVLLAQLVQTVQQ